MQPGIMGLAQADAGKLVPVYWGGALVGRFIGSAVLRAVAPGKVLAGVALTGDGAAPDRRYRGRRGRGLCAARDRSRQLGDVPDDLQPGERGPWPPAPPRDRASICVAIVGGAIIPPLTGQVADLASLAVSLAVPAACYAVIAGYGIYARRPA